MDRLLGIVEAVNKTDIGFTICDTTHDFEEWFWYRKSSSCHKIFQAAYLAELNGT